MAKPQLNQRAHPWCKGGTALVSQLRNVFDQQAILVRSPHHIQVQLDSKVHNIWIDSAHVVKFRLADQAGRAEIAGSFKKLKVAICGHEETKSDLVKMRRALEITELIDSAKAAIPHSGLSRAVFVDAGYKGTAAQIGVVRIAVERDGEHVQAESHPVSAANSNEAEQAAIDFALEWVDEDEVIFCDNRSVVDRARKEHGDRIRWLPREKNKVADRVANLRSTKKKSSRRRKKKPAANRSKS